MSDRVLVNIDDLPVGSQLRHAVNDSANVLLVAPGIVISDRIKQQLIRRGLTQVSIHADDLRPSGSRTSSSSAGPGGHSETTVKRKPKSTHASKAATQRSVSERIDNLCNTVSVVVKNEEAPVKDRVAPQRTQPYDDSRSEVIEQQIDTATNLVEQIANSMLQGEPGDGAQLATLSNDGIREMIADADQTMSCTINHPVTVELIERSVRVSFLAMAMAIEMGYDNKNVREVGVCALVCDLGLLTLPEYLHDPKHPFSKDDWLMYMSHPTKTFNMIERMPSLSDSVRVAAYQVHELSDGTGFPRGLRRERTHAYARLVSVADAYMTLTSQAQGRPAICPHDAMLCLLEHTALNHCDRIAVRAILHVLSAYPIGSRVLLSDNTEAIVKRRNGHDYLNPIVVRQSESGEEEWVNLKSANLQIVRPLLSNTRLEMRLDRDLMSEFVWQVNPGDWRGPLTP